MTRIAGGLFALVLLAAPAAQAQDTRPARVGTIDGLFRHLSAACRDPRLAALGVSVTVRFALRADGSLIGPPLVTKVEAPMGVRDDVETYRREAAAVMATCTPVPLTAELGRAIAGRQYVLRFGARTGPERPRVLERAI